MLNKSCFRTVMGTKSSILKKLWGHVPIVVSVNNTYVHTALLGRAAEITEQEVTCLLLHLFDLLVAIKIRLGSLTTEKIVDYLICKSLAMVNFH